METFGAAVTALTQPARTALSLPKAEPLNVGTSLGGAAVGYMSWKKHPWLGAVAGLSAGNAAYTLLKSPLKRDALTPIGAAAGAVAGVKYAPRKYSVLGFVAGLLAGGLAGNFVSKKV